MTHEPVISSAIKSVGYDDKSKKMEIKFKSGNTFQYDDVEREAFEALRDAPSVGKHFNEHWRNS